MTLKKCPETQTKYSFAFISHGSKFNAKVGQTAVQIYKVIFRQKRTLAAAQATSRLRNLLQFLQQSLVSFPRHRFIVKLRLASLHCAESELY